MEVVAAEPSGDVDDFSYEVEARDFFALHGASVEFGGVDTTGCDFGLFVAFGASGCDAPGVQLLLHDGEGRVGPVGRMVEFDPALREACGQNRAEGKDSGGVVAASVALIEGLEDVDAGGEIEFKGLAGAPVGGGLQGGGAADATMGDEHFFAKAGAGPLRATGGDDFGRETREIAPLVAVVGAEDEWYEAGSAVDDAQTKLLGKLVAEAGSTHLRDGETSSGDDDGGCLDEASGGFDMEAGALGDGVDGGAELNFDASLRAFLLEQINDVLGGTIAEELTEGFFVIAYAMFFNERDEVCGSVASESGLGEVRIFGEEVFGAAVDVGKVAAASAGDQDFFTGLVGVVEEQDGSSALSGGECGHHSGSTCS